MKINKIVTNHTEIWRILTKTGWPTTPPEFDEPQDLAEWDICQLIPGTVDGFQNDYDQYYTSGTDPPECYLTRVLDKPEFFQPPRKLGV